MSQVKKANIHALWEASKTENMIAVYVVFSQSVISKITGRTCSKQSNCKSKRKVLARDYHRLNRILIFNRFVNCEKMSKFCNNACVAVSQFTILQRRH